MAGRGKRKFGDDNGFGDWGGYMNAKISKLENQYLNELHEGESGGKLSNIFSAIAIFVNGYTTPTAEELKRIMISHGGTYHHYFNSRTTTHIIASNLCEAKIKKLRGNEKFVKPEWITDSVKANILLDFKPYLLYTGPTLDKAQQKLTVTSVIKKNNELPEKLSKQDDGTSVTEVEIAEPTSDSKHPREMKRAGEDDFLSEFYKRSRLHHISTMGAEFKRLVGELRERNDGIFPGIELLKNWKTVPGSQGNHLIQEAVFMHIDMDCFFVSVGLRSHPSLVGKPVVVTHARADSKPLPRRDGANREFEFDCYKEHWIKKSKFSDNNRDNSTAAVSDVFPRLQDLDETCSMSEIASCSYEARAAGIYNGMFMGAALKLCPSLVAIPYDFTGYKEVSTILYNTVASYTLDIEAVSCDELYADISSILRQTGLTPNDFATHLKEVIFTKTRCNASVGMGPNMLMARLATKKAKPNGLIYISKAEMSEFIKNHRIEDLPGVGRSMAHRLHALGVNTCLDMQQVSLGKLQQEFGQKQGETLFFMCRGEDKRTLKTDHIRKSISADINYGVRFANDQEMYKFVKELSTEVSKRMEEIHVRGRQLTLKLKIRAKDAPVETAKFMGHGVCDSISRSTTLALATRDIKTIDKEAMLLLKQLKVDCCDLRGMGIQLSKLVPDNSAKGKQPLQNSLLNFVSRAKPTFSSDNFTNHITEVVEVTDPLPIIAPSVPSTVLGVSNVNSEFGIPDMVVQEEEESSKTSIFELPSVSQIDSTVFNQLPDDLKRDIIKEYKRKGIALNGIECTNLDDPEPVAELLRNNVAGPSNVRPSSNVERKSRSDNPVSYDGIEQVTDIDASYWSALPDDIKAEIESDFQQRKKEATSPVKGWKNIFKAQQSPTKPISKPTKRKIKGQDQSKAKGQPVARVTIHPSSKESNEISENITQGRKEDLTLSGASTLPEIRQLLKEWFSSTDYPEEEDCEAVSNYLANVVKNKELHKVEPVIHFLKRNSTHLSDLWKRAVEDIINKAQLYVIQYYNAPLKLPSTISA